MVLQKGENGLVCAFGTDIQKFLSPKTKTKKGENEMPNDLSQNNSDVIKDIESMLDEQKRGCRESQDSEFYLQYVKDIRELDLFRASSFSRGARKVYR